MLNNDAQHSEEWPCYGNFHDFFFNEPSFHRFYSLNAVWAGSVLHLKFLSEFTLAFFCIFFHVVDCTIISIWYSEVEIWLLPTTEQKKYVQHNDEQINITNLIDNYLWRLVKLEGIVKVVQGDVIRFGRIPFRVSRIRFGDNKGKHVVEEQPGLV